MLFEQHCSGCTKFSNNVKATVTFFPLSKMAREFWPVNFKGSDQSFLCIIKPTDSVADGKNVTFSFLLPPFTSHLWVVMFWPFLLKPLFLEGKMFCLCKIYTYINPIKSLPM